MLQQPPEYRPTTNNSPQLSLLETGVHAYQHIAMEIVGNLQVAIFHNAVERDSGGLLSRFESFSFRSKYHVYLVPVI